MIGDGPAELVGTSQRAARADHRHPDRNLFVQAAAGLLLWAIKIPIAVLILRLMEVIP